MAMATGEYSFKVDPSDSNSNCKRRIFIEFFYVFLNNSKINSQKIKKSDFYLDLQKTLLPEKITNFEKYSVISVAPKRQFDR